MRLDAIHGMVRTGLSLRGIRRRTVKLPEGSLVPRMAYLDARARYRPARKEGGAEDVPPLAVFLHGLGSSVVTWATVLPHLSRSVPCVAPDLPGYGGTALPEGRAFATLADKVESVRTFIDVLSPDRPVQLVGQSMGGWIAASVAAALPDRVERLVLTNPAGVFTPQVFEQRRLFSPRDRAETRRLWQAMWHRLPRSFPFFVGQYQRVTEDPAVQGFMGTIEAEDFLNDRLGRIQARTLLVWGLSDELLDYQTVRIMEESVPDVEVRLIPDCGHVPQREAPEVYLSYLTPFLRGEDPPAMGGAGEVPKRDPLGRRHRRSAGL